MDNIQNQIRALQTSVRRQRFAIVTLASILAGSALIVAVRPAGDATFDTITCKTWKVVDEDGKARIEAFSSANGVAGVFWSDKRGMPLIQAFTNTNGSLVNFVDNDGMGRIQAGTGATGSIVVWRDKDGKQRITAGTLADSTALVSWTDKDGKNRINAGTKPDGTVIYPTKDGN